MIGRLNRDGTPDTAWNPGTGGDVYCMAVQADGKVLVGGYFTTLGGQPRQHICWLNSDGALDAGFNPGANFEVVSLAVQEDGKILVGGSFTTLAGQSCTRLGRLNPNGILDPNFNSQADLGVTCLAVQADGKILVGGGFTALGGQARNYIGRLNSNGTLDTSFDPGASYLPSSIVVQANGKILVGGFFSTLGGQPRDHIGRLNADGTLDPTFNQGTDQGIVGNVWSAAVQTDGMILVGGSFTTLAGQSRTHIGRLINTDPATQLLSSDVSGITWLRGGTSPEVSGAWFDASTNGTDWVNLGVGARISGGWQLRGVAVPTNAIIRARGYVTGGVYNGSAGIAESLLCLPTVVSQPVSRTNSPASMATFSVTAEGLGPLTYQWGKDGIDLVEGGNVSGVRTPTLTLSNVVETDEGGYSVIISNTFGSVTSLVATLTILDPFIASQPASQYVDAGDAVELRVTALGTGPFGYQWRKDGLELVGATSTLLTLTNAQRADAAGYDVLVSNEFGTVTSVVAILTVNLASADTFDPTVAGIVYTTAIQMDGKFLVGGSFTMLCGQTRTNIGRLNADSTLDTSFDPGANGTVDTLALQADGKILVGGSFTKLGSQWRYMIGRFNSDGSVDTNYNPGANSPVYCLAPQADGKTLVGGAFYELGGHACTNIGRLNVDGTLDTNFDASALGAVYSLAVQPDGRVLIGGAFTTLNGQPRSHLGRLYADGSLDTNFNPGAGSTVSGLAVLPDGRILIGGYFQTLGGQPRNYIGRLNADGSLDSIFDPGANDYVFSLAVQANGKIQVGGNFTTLGGQPRSRIGRLNNDDTLDLNFNPGANGCVYSLALQADGTTLVGGDFTTLGSQTRHSIGRLNDTEPALQYLACNATAITWLRAGSSPEIARASIEASANGNDWVSLGAGERTADGWQFTGVSVPTNTTIRARGVASGGQYNRSSWIVEASIVTSLPLILTQPLSQTNNIGAAANFVAVAGGTPPLSYQWCKDGTNIAGATTPGLCLTNVQQLDQGSYSVVVSNGFGSVTSSAALLVVNGGSRCQFSSVSYQGNGGAKLQFSAPAGPLYVVKASTNLVTWELIGPAEDKGDGTFAFEDADAAKFPYRYYQIQQLTEQ
jgi:uncharacterized delta-60 repeat protein